MRFTKQIRRLLVGLPLLVAHSFVIVLPAAGWDWNVFGASDNSQPAVSKPPVKREGAITPTNPRWTDGAVKQAFAQGTQPSSAVQQTAHAGPSRGGTLFGGNSAPANGKNGPTWHGQQVRMPTKMFSRGATATPTRPASPNSVAKNFPGVTTAARTRPQAAIGRPAATTQVAAQSRTANQSRPNASAPATVAKRAANAASSTSPTLAVTAEPTLADPTPGEPTPAETAAATIEPKTPGDRLILQANEMSARASTEEDYSRIIETCRRARASKLSPQLGDFANNLSAWSLNRRGQLKAEAGHVKEAILDFDDAVRANPKLWRALHNRGVLRAQSGQFELAFDDFNLTIQFNPKFAKAYSNRAALFVVAGDLPAALDDYTHATELDSNLAVAHRGRARVCHQLGQLEEALDHYDAAVQLAPDDAYAIASRADLLTDLGRYVDAAKGYNQAIKLDAKSTSALRGSAWLLATCPDQSVRNAKLAVDRAKRAIEIEGKDDAVGLDTLAAAEASAGDFTAAMHTLRQAIQIAPSDEREVYQDRLQLYQRAKPYRIAPLRGVAQVSYDTGVSR
jgi:tetratricopeptide (TPR) repeat protein